MKSFWVPIRLDVSSEPQQRIIDTVLIDTSSCGGVEYLPSNYPSQLAFSLIADALVHPIVRLSSSSNNSNNTGRPHFTGRLESSHLAVLWKQGTKQLEEQFRAIQELQQLDQQQRRRQRSTTARRRHNRQTTLGDDTTTDRPLQDATTAVETQLEKKREKPSNIVHDSYQEPEPDTKMSKTFHDSTDNNSRRSSGSSIAQRDGVGSTLLSSDGHHQHPTPEPSTPYPNELKDDEEEAELIPIHLRLCFNGIYVHDDFNWDPRLEGHISPLDMAVRIAHDLNLAEDAIPIIAVAIVEQIHGITMAHHMDEDETERTTAAWPVPAHSNINHAAIVSRNHLPINQESITKMAPTSG